MSDDPQQAPDKFADEQPYSGENDDADTPPDAQDDSDAADKDTERD